MSDLRADISAACADLDAVTGTLASIAKYNRGPKYDRRSTIGVSQQILTAHYGA